MITHPEKVLFPADGITKGELAAYYESVASAILPHIRRRPMTMERFPSGIEGKGFFQKDVSRGFPPWLERIEVPKRGGVVHHPLIDDARALMWMVNQNTITPHVWNRRAPDLHRPDLCVFDLDPAGDDPVVLRAAALAVRDVLLARGLASWVKTSGSKGFHIAVPLDGTADEGAVMRFAHSVAEELIRRDPDHLTLAFAKADRGGRIYVDIGRNGWSATYAAPYAVRPRPGAPVSAPITWDELASGLVGPRSFDVRNMRARLADVGDLWAALHDAPVRL